jgi:hypothetical protein
MKWEAVAGQKAPPQSRRVDWSLARRLEGRILPERINKHINVGEDQKNRRT